MKEKAIVSACLLGVFCRYDGDHQKRDEMVKLYQDGSIIPVCPEQLGGLTTPRDPAESVCDRVLTINGNDVTDNFARGAKDALALAKLIGAKKAYLKTDSPMCGHGRVYDGTFSGKLIEGDGILTKLLKDNDFEIIPIE